MDGQWFLEAVAVDGSRVRYLIGELPYSVGRDAGNRMVIDALGLSRHHAELSADISGRPRLTDLNSTNGTFVNRERLNGSALLADGDILHFGNSEYRLGCIEANRTLMRPAADMRTMVVTASRGLSEHFSPFEFQFIELLGGKGLAGAAQPIVAAGDGSLFGYELLGRANHPGLPGSPLRLFQMASQLGLEADLSAAFRAHGVHAIAERLRGEALFLNTHPCETFEAGFFQALIRLREQYPGLAMVLEIHETAIMETRRMRELAAQLTDIDVRFAYDDFGAGQARLNELGEVPAHFVKFDMGLIRDIHRASDAKRRVVGDLVRLVNDLGSISLAEGVETEAEADACRGFGFQLFQGYLFGKPVPIDTVTARD